MDYKIKMAKSKMMLKPHKFSRSKKVRKKSEKLRNKLHPSQLQKQWQKNNIPIYNSK
jgi:hypothetical protein